MTGNKRIIIDFVESEDQRYPTCGDYIEYPDHYHITVTKQVDTDRSLLIAFHEMVEYFLCTRRGIQENSITEYDIEWNKQLEQGRELQDEPGNEPGCIYAKEHRFAENIERQIALEAGIDWLDYDSKLII